MFLSRTKSILRPFNRYITSIGENNEISPVFTNRNPRNLERLRIGYKPDGYHLEKPGNCYWHKLELKQTGRHVVAVVKHHENGEVIKVSTEEWAIRKRLYSTKDISAYVNVGRVLAQRCLEYGILEMSCFLDVQTNEGKISSFINAVKEGGVKLQEPQRFKPHRPWDQDRPEKPWEVIE